MMSRMSKESEEYRIEMLRRLENEDSGATPPEVLEAEKVISEYRDKKVQIIKKKLRLRLPLPNPDLCPQCFYPHGKTSLMQPIPSGTAPTDIFECKTCGYIQERNPRP
jgi:hypothetical protein